MLGCRTMRMIWSSRFWRVDRLAKAKRRRGKEEVVDQSYLEAFVLEDPLDGGILA
jgi:hypothetical protein